MDRSPARDGPPPCFGRRQSDDDTVCNACPYTNRCTRATDAAAQRRTVTEAADALLVAPSVEYPAEDELLRYAQECMGRALPGGFPDRPHWRNKMLPVLRTLRLSCQAAGWNPKRYILAQVDALWALLDRGVMLSAGHFIGANADERFRRWLVRFEHKNGNAKVDRTSEAKAAADRRQVATAVYATMRFNGADQDTALQRAHEQDSTWVRSSVTDAERLAALEIALMAHGPTLPRSILMPEGPITWGMIFRLGAYIYSSRGGVRGVTSGLDGETT